MTGPTDEQRADRIRADLFSAQDAHEPIGEYRPSYNGWVNRETWNTVLWMQNDQGSAEGALEVVRDAIHYADWDSRGTRDRDMERSYLIGTAGRALREWWQDERNPDTDENPASPLSDAWSYAMACVDWDAVAEAIAEGHEIEHLPAAR